MKITKSAILMALILTWVSLWISTHDVPLQDSQIQQYMENPTVNNLPVAKRGGWPFAVFNYPPAPLGSDIPMDGSIFPFALNVTFYFIILWVLLNIMPKRWKILKFEKIIIFTAFIINTLGLLHTVLMFD